MKILAVETSCDETALALVEAGGGLKNPRFRVLKTLVASQIKIHRPFGGVVPNLAKREHLKNLPILFGKIFANPKSETLNPKQILNPKFQISKIDLLAVTVGPGLEPALWTGINFAKEIYQKSKIKNPKLKLAGVNHLEGHLYSFLLPTPKKAVMSNVKCQRSKVFPAIALIASGGHTILLKMDSLIKWKKLGETRDDAAGEAFDKVARLLGLPYPGGPEIEKLAKYGSPTSIDFPRPMINQKNYDFSFSGLKTAVFYYLRDPNPPARLRLDKVQAGGRIHPNDTNIRDIRIDLDFSDRLMRDVAASFQQALIDVMAAKTFRAVKEFNARSIMISGGVAANKLLRKTFKNRAKKSGLNFLAPPSKYNLDNAAMIAAAAYIGFCSRKKPSTARQLTAKADLDL